jgi:hypothetical protein
MAREMAKLASGLDIGLVLSIAYSIGFGTAFWCKAIPIHIWRSGVI